MGLCLISLFLPLLQSQGGGGEGGKGSYSTLLTHPVHILHNPDWSPPAHQAPPVPAPPPTSGSCCFCHPRLSPCLHCYQTFQGGCRVSLTRLCTPSEKQQQHSFLAQVWSQAALVWILLLTLWLCGLGKLFNLCVSESSQWKHLSHMIVWGPIESVEKAKV